MLNFLRRDRGRQRTLVLLPGWATDSRIFARLDLPYNYLEPNGFTPLPAIADLRAVIAKHAGGRASLLGFSLGGFLAAAFAREHPDMVEELILLGVRRQYPPAELAGVRAALARDPAAFLEYFYQRAMHTADDDPSSVWFNARLRDSYLAHAGDAALTAGLNCLARQRLEPAELATLCNVRLLHGELDLIAPVGEAHELASAAARLDVIPGAGHLLPLHLACQELLRGN